MGVKGGVVQRGRERERERERKREKERGRERERAMGGVKHGIDGMESVSV